MFLCLIQRNSKKTTHRVINNNSVNVAWVSAP